MWDLRHGCPLKVEEIIRNRDGTNVTSRLIFYFGFRLERKDLKFAEVKLIYLWRCDRRTRRARENIELTSRPVQGFTI
jgi:hypothetical protein